MLQSPYRRPVQELSESVFHLQRHENTQLGLFDDIGHKERLVEVLDEVNSRWGDFTVTPAKMLGMENIVLDRISFGNIKELYTSSNEFDQY